MLFKNFDFLGLVFGFTYDDSMRFQTNFGGFLSMILGLLSLITVGSMGVTLLDRTSPSILQDVQKYYSPPALNFDSRFNVAFRMTAGSNNLYKDLDKVKMKFFKNTIYKSNFSNVTEVEVPVAACTPEKFPYQKDYFDQFSMNESLCPIMDGKNIKGGFLSEYWIYYQIKFSICLNDPKTGKSVDGDGIICKNLNEIENFLHKNSVRAHIFFGDSDYDPTNYTDPTINYLNNYNINIYFQTQRQTHLYFNTYNMTSDDTYFFLSPSQRKFSQIAYSTASERAATRESNMNDLVVLNIRSDFVSNTIRRSYTGFAQIAANVGAILNIVFLFFNGVVFLVSRMQFFIKLVKNSIYLHYKNPQYMLKLTSDKVENVDKDKNKQTEFTQIVKGLEESNVNFINNTENVANELKEGKLKQVNQIEVLNLNNKKIEGGGETKNTFLTKVTKESDNIKKFENFKLVKYDHDSNLFEILFISLCPCLRICNKKLNRDMIMIEYSKKHYYKYTDFFKFLDKFIELNIIKKLLLKKDEIEVIDVLKRIVMIKKFDILDIVNPRVEKNEISTTTNNFKDKLKKKGSIDFLEEKLKKYISTTINKENKSTIENNFLERFDDILKG